jgi:hypothetical protein
MGEAVQSIHEEPEHTVEVLVHVSETLEGGQRGNVVAALEKEDGIVSAEFCPLRYHLMLVRYDRDRYTSQDVLGRVTSQRLQARLIGPV